MGASCFTTVSFVGLYAAVAAASALSFPGIPTWALTLWKWVLRLLSVISWLISSSVL